ncbi:sulfatase [Haloferula chungangensis]|uniref:Sulfatase n=1 Tax=Haloferula chungangensis TaxID=1048331 RepID=A0ABW2L8R7_9BACT
MWITVAILAFAVQSAHAERPNIVFLLSDDQSYGDYGFMGHPHIKTPNIDRLAAAGVVYERGYVTAPLCRPSLASMATGLYPHQTGIRGNDPVGYKESSKEKQIEMRAHMTSPMASMPSFIKSLKEGGYATLQTGKWWEGDPLDHGFTDAMTHGDPSKGGRHGDKGLDIGRKTMEPIYDFIDQSKADEKPFLIWYGVFLPHSPHNAPDRLFNKYKDIAPNEPTARYWANVEWLDEGCGQIVDYLKKEGLYENTIFIYTCDNGWVQNPNKLNASIRSKREPVEAGIRTPIFITQEGTIKPLRDSETLASNIDIAPTILKACGIEPPKAMSGLDLRETAALKKRDRVFVDVYEHDSDLDKLDDLKDGLVAHVVIDSWDKLTATLSGNELYDLKTDPDDRRNIAAKNPEKVARLSKLIDEWLKDTPALMTD